MIMVAAAINRIIFLVRLIMVPIRLFSHLFIYPLFALGNNVNLTRYSMVVDEGSRGPGILSGLLPTSTQC
jgi:hypothetical protein